LKGRKFGFNTGSDLVELLLEGRVAKFSRFAWGTLRALFRRRGVESSVTVTITVTVAITIRWRRGVFLRGGFVIIVVARGSASWWGW
jgi:hypothetical protein